MTSDHEAAEWFAILPWFVASLRCMPQSCTTTNPNTHMSTGYNYHRNLRTQATCNLPRVRIPRHELLQPCFGCRVGQSKNPKRMMRHKERPQHVSIVACKEHKAPAIMITVLMNSKSLQIAALVMRLGVNIALPPGANGISTASCLSGQDLSGTSRPTTDVLPIESQTDTMSPRRCAYAASIVPKSQRRHLGLPFWGSSISYHDPIS